MTSQDPAVQRPPTSEVLPRQLGRYTLLQRVGEGGMGVVYRARTEHDRDVAIKVMRPHIAHDEGARHRLEREVRTLSRVHHPRIAAVIDADVDGPAPFVVTEFVPGTPLDTVVQEQGPMRGPELMRLAEGLSEALGAIHAVGIVHRDLKPGNVLLVGRDPVVIDFGIAQVADDTRLTMTGMVMGTPGYLSPEVVEGGDVTDATDWWGWAATLAFAASGEPPFGRGPLSVVLDRVIRGRARLDGVDERLRPLLLAALDIEPTRRPDSHQVMRALELYAADRPVTEALPQQRPVAGTVPGAEHTRAQPVVDQTRMQPITHTQVHPVAPPPGGWPQQQAPPASPYLSAGRPGARPSAPVLREPAPYAGYQSPYGGPDGASYPIGQRADPRIGRPMRSGTLAAALVAFVGLAATLPVLAWAALGLWSVAARTVDQGVTSMVLRRHESGPRRSDVPVAVLASPWHLLVGGLTTLLYLVLPVGFALVTAAVTALGLDLSGVVPGVTSEHPAPVAVGSLLGAVTAWWGPGGLSLRRGSRTVVRAAVPNVVTARVVATLLAVLGVFMLGLAVSESLAVSWWPVWQDAPWRGLLPTSFL